MSLDHLFIGGSGLRLRTMVQDALLDWGVFIETPSTDEQIENQIQSMYGTSTITGLKRIINLPDEKFIKKLINLYNVDKECIISAAALFTSILKFFQTELEKMGDTKKLSMRFCPYEPMKSIKNLLKFPLSLIYKERSIKKSFSAINNSVINLLKDLPNPPSSEQSSLKSTGQIQTINDHVELILDRSRTLLPLGEQWENYYNSFGVILNNIKVLIDDLYFKN